MADKRAGLRGPDKTQDDLQDARQGAHDPVGNVVASDTNQQTSHERAQPGADARGGPVPAGKHAAGKDSLPEGLKRERKGPLNKSDGRGGIAGHVPNPGTRPTKANKHGGTSGH